MNELHYDEWTKNRIDKIVSIFGKNWFANKKVLELGCNSGEIGIQLLKYGADVSFCDIEKENLLTVENKLSKYNIKPKLLQIDQENKYHFDQDFDLVLNFSVLYHLYNWKQDLKCSVESGNITLLETIVCPDRIYEYLKNTQSKATNLLKTLLTENQIESELRNNGYKFLRIEDSELNTSWCRTPTDTIIKHVYDWTQEDEYNYEEYEKSNNFIHFRRMWMIMR